MRLVERASARPVRPTSSGHAGIIFVPFMRKFELCSHLGSNWDHFSVLLSLDMGPRALSVKRRPAVKKASAPARRPVSAASALRQPVSAAGVLRRPANDKLSRLVLLVVFSKLRRVGGVNGLHQDRLSYVVSLTLISIELRS